MVQLLVFMYEFYSAPSPSKCSINVSIKLVQNCKKTVQVTSVHMQDLQCTSTSVLQSTSSFMTTSLKQYTHHIFRTNNIWVYIYTLSHYIMSGNLSSIPSRAPQSTVSPFKQPCISINTPPNPPCYT